MWLLILFLLCGNCFAQNVITITQYGYITDNNGNIIGKYDNDVNTGKQIALPPGYTYTSVPTESAIESVQIYQNPQVQLNVLRQQTLNSMVDAQIATNPTNKSMADSLKSKGAQ